MTASQRDPYQTLGVSPHISDEELHSAYRRLVKLHHPDHNDGSPEAARRFEEIQDAYTRIRELRERTPRQAPRPGPAPTVDPETAARLEDLERQVREAHLARERAQRAAREAAQTAAARPTDEELGYVTTDDSFSKLLDDALAELSERFADARSHPATRRLANLIDGLASKVNRDTSGRGDDES
jgi:curved DNA-binding protein CbpA